MKNFIFLTVFATLLVAGSCETPIEDDSEVAIVSGWDSLVPGILGEAYAPSSDEPTNLTLTMTDQTFKCKLKNLPPNSGYVVTFTRNEIAFGFYRVRPNNVIWSTMNLDTILDFYPTKGAFSLYPNFTVDVSSDSKLFGDYQCSVKLLGGVETVYNSNRLVVAKAKALTPEMKWRQTYPEVNISFGLDKTTFNPSSIYEAKCKVRFDRTVSEYIIYFMAENKIIGAYLIQTDPPKIKWQLFPRNLLESKHQVLQLEEESSYPTYSILLKLTKQEKLGCKIEIPSKKHPISYYSEQFDFNSTSINVKSDDAPCNPSIKVKTYKDNGTPTCKVDFEGCGGNYNLSVVRKTNGEEERDFGHQCKSGEFQFEDNSHYYLRCKVEYDGETYLSDDSV